MNTDTHIELPKRKRNPDDGELDITPMIDVTFLLLAFFVVVSNMDPQKALDLPVASYGETIADKNSVVLLVTPDESGSGHLIYKGRSKSDDTLVGSGTPRDQENEIGDFVENDLSNSPEKKSILIKAEGDVKTGTVQLVKRGVGRSQLAKTREIYVGVEEER